MELFYGLLSLAELLLYFYILVFVCYIIFKLRYL